MPNEEYNKAAGSNHRTPEGKPVLDAASPAAIVIVTLFGITTLILLGWGLMIVLAP